MKMKAAAVILAVALSGALAAGCGTGGGSSAASGAVSGAQASDASGTGTESGTVSDTVSGTDSGSATASGTSASAAAGASSDASSGSGTDSTSSVSLKVKIDSADGTMEIMAPDTWQDMKGQLDESGSSDQNYPLQAGSYDDETFLTANGESKTNSSLTSLQEYSDTILKGVTASTAFSNVQAEATTDVTLTASGLPAKRTKFIAAYGSQQIAYWIYAAEGTSRYYQICCWTADDNAVNAEPVIEAVVNSFKELA